MTDEKSGRGVLFVVGTPLGNLEDITLRALRVLKEADLIAAEDTRVCRKLLSHFGIQTPTTSFHEHSPPAKLRRLLDELQSGKDVALVSDAGMPAISDPGEALVKACIEQDISVVAVPGPNAAVTALAVSGLPTDQFVFVGFLPRKSAARKRLLSEIGAQQRTLVIHEAPHRLAKTLADAYNVLGNRRAVVVRELTKRFEEIIRQDLASVCRHFEERRPRGEITLLIEGASGEKRDQSAGAKGLAEAVQCARGLIRDGFSRKDAAHEAASAFGISRRLLYNALLDKDKAE